jgi:serine/threonine-protein kinase HipA
MSDSLLVVLGDTVAGMLTRLRGGRLRFDYDAAYREQSVPTPISLSMPVQIASHPDRAVTPWLWGLLPDNEAVLRRWAREFHVSASSPFSLLGTQIGEDCAGAIRFAAPQNLDRVLELPENVTWLTEANVAQRLRELREDSTSWLGRSFTGQFSLAGAQPKTALLFEDGRWGVPSGATPTTHILKPAVTGLDDHDLNEHLCLDAAHRAGLIVARTRVARFAEESAVVVARYDRVITPDGRRKRVHQEDLCQALGMPPSLKYQNEGGPTPAQIARLLRDAMPAKVAEEAVWRFADALIWNWLIAGTDAHAKNYSLLLAADQVRLAPLYDIASALPYGTHERKLRFAMKIGESYDVFPGRDEWPGAARDLSVDAEALLERVRELAHIAPSAFSDAVNAPSVKAVSSDLPGKLLELVVDRISRCLKLL